MLPQKRDAPAGCSRRQMDAPAGCSRRMLPQDTQQKNDTSGVLSGFSQEKPDNRAGGARMMFVLFLYAYVRYIIHCQRLSVCICAVVARAETQHYGFSTILCLFAGFIFMANV